MTEQRHNVMVGVPTYPGHAYCRPAWIDNTIKLVGNRHVMVVWNGDGDPRKLFPPEWEIRKIKAVSGERGVDVLMRKQNIMRNEAISRGYSHLFLLESDVFPPANAIDTLLACDAPVASGVYPIRSEQHLILDIPDNDKYRQKYDGRLAGKTVFAVRTETSPCVWGYLERDDGGVESRLWRWDDALPQRGAVRIFSSGVGVVLISRDVLERISFRLPPDEWNNKFTDFAFFKDCFDRGIPVYANTDVLAAHVHPIDEEELQDKWFNAETLERTRQDAALHRFA